MLGTIKRRINGSQDPRTRRAMLREDRDAKREGNGLKAFPLELEMEILGVFADPFGALACHILRGIRQDQDKFIATVPTWDILCAHKPEQQAAQFTQDLIAHSVA